MEGISSYGRPMSAAARAAAMRVKMAGAGVRVTGSLPGAAPSSLTGPTYLAALEKLTTTTEKWLESIEKLREAAVKQQKRAKPEDPASCDERVHKTPLYKLAARKKQAEDVVMKEASRILAEDDSGKSVGSNERIRPSTPTNMPKIVEPPSEPVSRLPGIKLSGPVSPPARKLDNLDIKSQSQPPKPELADPMNVDSSAPNVPRIVAPALDSPSTGLFRPPVTTAQTSVVSIPSTTPPTLVTPPPLATTGEVHLTKDPVLTAAVSSDIAAPVPLPLPLRTKPSANSLKTDTSVKSSDALSTSAAKKRRLSAKTILESLMEKKSRNPIWYDGEIQKIFTDMVFEMSQQIQSMKREGRIVMFAKDPACRNLLVSMDNMLQKSLRIVEVSSFLFLKGKPDVNQVETLKTDLQKSLKAVEEFKNSGWTMSGNDDDDDDDDDSDSENDDE
ncbi:hypothetical protein TWF106_002398 [Orbilia oligospora]|uniref:Uncharacterized protein n=1 Tax=Orbilia oligospora TaxID=2813651 RepID=A0A6G1M5A8_ORBOL|nr:hypothetical protein TWF788_001779 [Orbilia oligospora]KAF3200666.1 hypothetical protein TWF679_000704 [Orbilia oligospora]KAF3202365.1 hypothetical protein TWF106_002398 [Orbilia oligospora]KAF3222787.1 hypothetical protein TWF191_006603 [Orbilia oligospora]KAF3246089.1 hypothetical protein TWF192_006940 [Orbilia oligospora]